MNRRKFIKKISGSSLAIAAALGLLPKGIIAAEIQRQRKRAEEEYLEEFRKKASANAVTFERFKVDDLSFEQICGKYHFVEMTYGSDGITSAIDHFGTRWRSYDYGANWEIDMDWLNVLARGIDE